MPAKPWVRVGRTALGVIRVLAVLYVFLLSITLLGTTFKSFGSGFSEALIASTNNPFVGLFIGILATSIVQSSSATSSMVVGMVAVGSLSLRNAVPLIMGANIGTSVTAVLVSLGHIRRKDEFKLGFGAALIHEAFKVIMVLVLFPLELTTRFLERTAVFICGCVWTGGQADCIETGFKGPLKVILGPVAKWFVGLFITKGEPVSGAALVFILLFSLVLLFGSLWLLTRMMTKAVAGRAEALIDRTIGQTPILGLVVGLVLTAVVQSSSAVTSILVPLAASGILTLDQVFPLELGSSLGTTVTAVLASLAAGPAGLAVALTHVLFNLTGVLIFFPFPWLRRQPVRFAKWFAEIAAESKRLAIAYVLCTFFIGPGILILITQYILP